jgi:hypothetical protein
MALANRVLTNDTATANAAQTLSGNPSGMVNGDWLYAILGTIGGTIAHAAPAGWTRVGSGDAFLAGVGCSVWRIKMQAGVSGPFLFDSGATANRRISLIFTCWSGGDPTSPIDGTPQLVTGTTLTSLTHAAITSGGAGRVWMLATAKTTGVGLTSTLTNPVGFTEEADLCTSSAGAGNVNLGVHDKAVGSGSTGTQAVSSSDVTNQTWAGIGFLMSPAGTQVITAEAAGTQTWDGQADGQVISAAFPVTGASPSTLEGGGFENVGCFAPPGVGHAWQAAIYGDVFGVHVTTDGITWKPSNKGIGGPHHSIRTLRGSGIEGSKTVANRLWGWSGQTPDGTAGGNLIRGTFDPATGLVAWTNWAQAADGPAGGTTGYGHPRMLGRLLALDEANDTAYGCTVNGICRITISTGAVTNARALAGEDVTGLVLDPTDPQIGWATVRRAYAGKANTPGVYRLTNLRSGTVTAAREPLTDCQDLCLLDTGTNRYLFVAAMNQGIRRWLVSANINTGWVDITNDYEAMAVVGTGAAGIDAIWDGSQIQVLAVNAGNANLTNAGGYTRLGLNAAPDWFNESPQWTVNMVPWGESNPWWLSVLIPGLMLGGTGYDSGCVRIDPNNYNRAMAVGRSGVWLSQNAWQTWRPAIKGTVGVMSWVVAARPNFGNQALEGNGDWSLEKCADFGASTPDPVRPRPGGGMGLMWTADGNEAAWACGDPFAGASEAGVFVSVNGGTTWVDQGLPVGTDAHGVAIGYNAAGTRVLLTVYRTGIYRKVGTGAWGVVSTLTIPQDSQAHNQHFCWPRNNDAPTGRRAFVYCTGHNGLLRSDDWGATWTTIHAKTNTGESAGAIAADPNNPDTLYYTVDNGVGADTGLWKITAASTTASAIKIGPTMTAPGPCAVDPNSGVVYVCTTALESGGAKLYASPANNPGAATSFVDITDAQWAHGPWAPCDMTVTDTGQIVVANRQGGMFVATRAGSVPVVQAAGDAILAFDLEADAVVIPSVAGVVTASGTLRLTATLLASATTVTAAAPVTGDLAVFDGIQQPQPVVMAAFGLNVDPGPDYLHLGVGPGLGTGKLGGATWTDISNDVLSISRQTPLVDAIEPTTSGTYSLILDNTSGAYDPENTAGPYVEAGQSLIDLDITIRVQALWEGEFFDRFLVYVDDILPNDAPPMPTVTFECVDRLALLGRNQLPEVNRVGDSELTGARVNRILDAAAVPTTARAIDAGRSRCIATTLGDFALPLVHKAVQTEGGFLWVDASGVIRFYDRYKATTAARSVTVQATFTDSGGMIELARSRSRDRLYNDYHSTRDPAPVDPAAIDPTDPPPEDEPVEQQAVSQASLDKYGVLTYPGEFGAWLRSDPDVAAMAQWLAPRYATARVRVIRVGMQGLGFDQWDELLGLRQLDRIRVRRTYSAQALPVDRELLIVGITEEIQRPIGGQTPSWSFGFITEAPATILEPVGVLRLGGTAGLGAAQLGF